MVQAVQGLQRSIWLCGFCKEFSSQDNQSVALVNSTTTIWCTCLTACPLGCYSGKTC